ncbi:MAG: SDR family NAD(P)-dependent oxidoreductase, partial [Planctomycetota bacterium]|nr:SDR family NAD(P)-dependent oxidoreductase [Planctomycetota bacterium]
MLPGLRQFDLTGKSAVITGGSKGLGKAIAAGLASAGAELLLLSRNNEEAKQSAAEIQHDYGTRAIGMCADVTAAEQCDKAVQRALAEFGKIDILVNSAGINIRGPIDELS